ncbi:hypothetical protein COLO4_25145 [Corchorus olitorius]|uniref:Zinc finger, CCHC-type n=1 Tax=Corchorus olitorius TaxID=93759 RepID=A0A1R3I4F1_9ROSI|nr:hypothetical protein COLO4_25145 [Corchorus olitorius]
MAEDDNGVQELANSLVVHKSLNEVVTCDDYYQKEYVLKDYESFLHPVKGPMFWEDKEEDEVVPLPIKVKKGRRQTERRREALEGRKKSSTHMSRVGRVIKCGLCKQPGHNKKRCPRMPKSQQNDPTMTKKRKTNESGSSKQQQKQPVQQGESRIFQKVNPGKETEYIIARPVGNVRKHTSVKKLKEAANRRLQTMRQGNPSSSNPNVVATPTQESRQTT